MIVVLGPGVVLPRRLRLISSPERAVLVWGGLRGALTISLALALPPEVTVIAARAWLADGRLTVADLKVYLWIRHLKSGNLDHIPADLADRVQQMGLAKPSVSVDEERVVRLGRRFCYGERRRVREAVRRPDHE